MNEYLESLKSLKESEDHIEFKAATHNYPYKGGSHEDPRDRRHCVLGYVVALANEKGGRLVLGMADKRPHDVVGSDFADGKTGSLVDSIYEALKIRIDPREEYEDGKRVLILTVPSRPVGRLLKFEGVALMRTGESLREMSDAEMFRILSEQEPDFSAKICDSLKLSDLDSNALQVMKTQYAAKQKNPSFAKLPDTQVLKDLAIMTEGGKLTNAALMLLGKETVLHKLLPQYGIIVEYRKNKASIQYDARKEYRDPLFLAIDKVWDYLNQPLTNPESHVSDGPYIFDVPAFNEASSREGILNGCLHRSMQIQSEVVIKMSPDELKIINPGGFPFGVSKDNILTVSSTPRCKLLSEVLEKTGLVERSGQGVDKMFTNSILDGKDLPTYEGTDLYQVVLTFKAELKNPKLMLALRTEQQRRGEDNLLNVFQLMALYNIYRGKTELVDDDMIHFLLSEKLITKEQGKYYLGTKDVGSMSVVKLTDRQRDICKIIASEPAISATDLSVVLSVAKRTIERALADLQSNDIIRHEGNTSAGRWVVTEKGLEMLNQ